jgi:predicted nucleotidyltransferase
MVDAQLVTDICRTLVARLNPRRIVLFGSRARGDARADSDVDLFIEMETDRTPPERAIEVSALFGLRPWSLDVVVYTPEEVARLRGVRGTLLAVVESEGEVLYERN